jgi:hypothetical protein
MYNVGRRHEVRDQAAIIKTENSCGRKIERKENVTATAGPNVIARDPDFFHAGCAADQENSIQNFRVIWRHC